VLSKKDMFNDWKKKIKENPQVDRHLLWDVNYDKIDWWAMRRLVVQRVIERGWMNDFYAIFRLYGGPKGVREIVKEIPAVMSPRNEAFARNLFNLSKNELQCYTRKRLRESYLNS